MRELIALLAAITAALVMLEKEVIGLSGIPLLGAWAFIVTLALFIPWEALRWPSVGNRPPP